MIKIDIASMSPASRTLFGVFLVLLSLVIVPFGDGLAKLLGGREYAPLQITWLRYSTHFMIALLLAISFYGFRGLKAKNRRSLLGRGLTMTFATFCFFTSIKYLPLADAIALIFVAPLVMTLLSGPLLGEKVGPWRWASVAVGFVGALLIIRPGGSGFDWASIWALAAAIGFGLYVVLTRRASGENPPLVSLLYMGFVGFVLLGLLMPFHWQPPAIADWPVFLSVGICALVGHGLLIWAADFIEASVIAPLHYVEIIGAVLVGYWLFGDLPDAYTLAGCGIVILAGLVITYREQRRKKRPPVSKLASRRL